MERVAGASLGTTFGPQTLRGEAEYCEELFSNFVDMPFPVDSIEQHDRQTGGKVCVVETPSVDRPSMRVGTRHIKRMHPTGAAEQMPCSAGVEAVLRELVKPLMNRKLALLHNEMKEALLGADGAVALDDLRRWHSEREANRAAVAAAFGDHR